MALSAELSGIRSLTVTALITGHSHTHAVTPEGFYTSQILTIEKIRKEWLFYMTPNPVK